MKIYRELLESAVGRCVSVVARRTTLPVLECVRLRSTDDGKLEVSATDLNHWYFSLVNLEEEPDEPMDRLVPARSFVSALSLCVDEVLEFSFLKGSRLKFDGFELATLPADEWPDDPRTPLEEKEFEEIPVDAAEFKAAVSWASPVIDPAQGNLRRTCLSLYGSPETLEVAAGFGATTRYTELPRTVKGGAFKASLSLIGAHVLTTMGPELLCLYEGSRKVVVTVGSESAVLDLVACQINSVAELLGDPSSLPLHVVCDAAAVRVEVARANVALAHADWPQCDFVFSKASKTLAIEAVTEAATFRGEVDLSKCSRDITWKLNTKFLADQLPKSGAVTIRSGDDISPIVIEREDSRARGVVMPCNRIA